jgi:DNA-binding transcriptional LysR family regulator
VALPPKHRLASRKAVRLEDLKEEFLIGYSRSGYPEYHEYLTKKLGCRGKNPASSSPIQEEHESVTSLMAAVESGRGVALVASCLGRLAGSRIKLRPVHPLGIAISLGIVWKGKLSEGADSHFLEIMSSVS